MRSYKHLLWISIAAVMLANPAASACPGCKEGIADQPGSDGRGLREGYFWSILLMAGMPLGLATAGGLAVARAARRGLLPQI